MKKHSLVSIFSVLFIVVLCVSLLVACQKIERIEGDQVEKLVVWSQISEGYTLNADDTARFIELFNASKYKGEGTGDGGTAEFGAVVYFRDGTYLRVSDFGALGKDFEVTVHNSDGNTTYWYYLNSKELYNFVSELADTSPKA